MLWHTIFRKSRLAKEKKIIVKHLILGQLRIAIVKNWSVKILKIQIESGNKIWKNIKKEVQNDWTMQGQPLGIEIKYRPGLTSCFDKSTKKWCSVASLVVEVYAWSTIWNFFDLTQPQRPPTEKVLKFNMSFHDSVKNQNIKIKWY